MHGGCRQQRRKEQVEEPRRHRLVKRRTGRIKPDRILMRVKDPLPRADGRIVRRRIEPRDEALFPTLRRMRPPSAEGRVQLSGVDLRAIGKIAPVDDFAVTLEIVRDDQGGMTLHIARDDSAAGEGVEERQPPAAERPSHGFDGLSDLRQERTLVAKVRQDLRR